jgi:chemotaxis protein methyltransferase CheR
MLLRDSGRFEGWDVQVFGSDISRRVIAAARQAEYGASSLRATPPEHLARSFEAAGGKWRVREEIRGWVTFGQLNLLSEDTRRLVPRMDAIFCRNLLIYLDVPARLRVLAALYDRLWEGGYLLLGHSESLINLTADFELVHLQNDLVYRRPWGSSGGTP